MGKLICFFTGEEIVHKPATMDEGEELIASLTAI